MSSEQIDAPGVGATATLPAERPQPSAPRRAEPRSMRADVAFPDPLTAPTRPVEPPLSPRTGEPRRTPLVTVAATLLCLGAAFYAVQLVLAFWAVVHHSFDATMLIRRIRPGEGSLPLVLLAVLAVLHLAAVAALASFSGFHAWNGRRFARWTALAAVLLSALTFQVGRLPLLGLVALVPGALLLLLPGFGRYARAQHDFRYLRSHPTAPEPLPDDVYYGPLLRYIDPER